MTDDEIRRLLMLRSEGPNLDYKAGSTWSKDNRDKKYELIRDLMAFANTKDGGRVIFGVRDEDLELIGVSAEIFESIDPTDVVSMLHDNGAPKARCAVFKREIDGRKLIVIEVAEFDETPIICTKGISTLDGSKRVILRQGAIYVRTGAGSTEEISASDDMRSLIARAVARKADELLKSFSDILTGRPVQLGESAAASYKSEITAAETFLQSKLEPHLKAGHFEIIAYPTVYNATRISTIPAVAEAVRESEVRLRGWNFPHTDKQDAGPFANGFQSITISQVFGRYVEGYRAHQSGLFIWKRAFWEDAEDRKSKDGQPQLSFVSAIYSFTEYLIFLSRFYERIAPEATVRFAITLRGCNGRELASFEPLVAFWEGQRRARGRDTTGTRSPSRRIESVAAGHCRGDGEARSSRLRLDGRERRYHWGLAAEAHQTTVLISAAPRSCAASGGAAEAGSRSGPGNHLQADSLLIP